MKRLRRLSILLISALFVLAPQGNVGAATLVDTFVDGFDFPLGAPEGAGYGVECCGGLSFLERYDYSGDGIAEYHPGEDWNDDNSGKDYGGDRDDKGDPIYSIANGKVLYSKYSGVGWGFLVLIEHTFPNGEKVWSQYGHLDSIDKKILNSPGATVFRGDRLGTVGDYPDGTRRAYHLHFELRKKFRPANAFVSNWSKEKVLEYYHNPSEFIRANRPVRAQEISLNSDANGNIKISWEASADSGLESYQLYRSEIIGGTATEATRTLIFESQDPKITEFIDIAKSPRTYYYCLHTTYQGGEIGISQEKQIDRLRAFIQITNHPRNQTTPFVYGDKVFWLDGRRLANEKPTQHLYYFDITEGVEKSIRIGSLLDKVPGAVSPVANNNYVCYHTVDSTNTGENIYCYNFEAENYLHLTRAPGHQHSADISEEDIVVWEDRRSGNSDIYYLDLKKAEGEVEFVSGPGNQVNPKIWGNKIVWKDSRVTNRYDLYIKEIGGQEELLVKNVGSSPPDIWSDYVVWSDLKHKLSMMNLKTKEITEISALGAQAVIRDGRVAYTKAEEGNSYIFVYDIKTKNTIKIDFKLSYLPFISLYGDILVFSHSEKQAVPNMDIFLTYL